MSERFYDSQRNRDALDAWITDEDRLSFTHDEQDEVVPKCIICGDELVEGESHIHKLNGDQSDTLAVPTKTKEGLG